MTTIDEMKADVTTRYKKEMVRLLVPRESLSELADRMRQIAKMITDATLPGAGEDRGVPNGMPRASVGVAAVAQSAVDILTCMVGYGASSKEIDHIRHLFKQCREAIGNADTVTLCDLLGYEIAPFLDDIELPEETSDARPDLG